MKEEDKIVRWVYLILLALIWGSSFIFMKRGLVSFPPDQVAAIRLFFAFLSLFPVVILQMKKVKKSYYKYIIASGFLGNGIPAFLFANAQTRVSSSMAGILNSLTPVFVLVVGATFFGSVFKKSHILGVIIGLAGAVALILLNANGNLSNLDNWFALLIVLACVCYAFSANILRKYLQEVNATHITGFALFAAGIPSGIYLFTTDFIHRLQTHPESWSSFGYILLLGIFGSALSTVFFNKLIKISNALYAASVTYLIPIVALAWGISDGEKLSFGDLLAMGGILLGVYLINHDRIKEIRATKAKQRGN